tara:strand:+ start:543 stop:2396 length:1854 start_codon:yes stop_codon:yes gene_type:complete
MHQQEGPFGVQPEQRGSEILTTFRLAGVGGGIKGVLNEKSLLLERRDGKGLRLDIEGIRRVRHHHIPVIPQGVTWMGFITLILAARVLSGQIQIYALAIGAVTIFGWLLGRRPTLCIDTEQGDRHILHGPDSLLLRTQMMINRLCEGKTLDEAREGLEEIQLNPNFPSISRLESVKFGTAAIQTERVEEAEILPEVGIFDEADLEQALKAMYHGGEGEIPEPMPAETETAVNSLPATESFSTDSPADQAGRGLLDRARDSLQSVRSESDEWNQQQKLDSWSKPWEQPAVENTVDQAAVDSAYQRAWGRSEPQWYCEKEGVQETRIQSALSDAREEGGGFFSGSMFDDPSPSSDEGGIFGSMFDTPSPSPAPSSTTQPVTASEPTPTWSGQAIRDAMPASSALATTLPEPTLHALREECTPGVVAAARVAIPEPEPQTNPVSQHNLEEFPALGALLRNSPKTRLRSSAPPKEGRLARLTKRGLSAFIRTEARPARKAVRPVRIEGDDYAEIYGDDDGFGDGQYRELSLRSGQILRLRADQDHQAEVAERIKTLSKSSGGAFADDEADALIERLSESGDLAPIANLLKAADSKQLSFGQLASTSPPKEAPGHHGIARLG